MVSVVIPVYRERERLPACLEGLMPQARGSDAEVLLVDGGSDDGTEAVAARFSGVTIIRAPRGRGSQMNAGARRARGSLLTFLHADTLLPAEAMATLASIDAAGSPAAGGFSHRFDRSRPLLQLLSRLHDLRASASGVFYGDQVPFVRRELFRQLGGFREDIDMEDVEFGTRLRRRVRPRRLPLRVVTSSRRFDRAGDVRAAAEAAYLLVVWTILRRVRPSKTFFTPVR
jgi:rSAM/selenodomain-associated transferase 2